MRRVVVTGLGLVTPLGSDVETTWKNLLAGKSGAGPITRFDTTGHKCTIACEVKPADHEYGFDPNKRVDHKVQRQVDPFIIFGIDAAGQALEQPVRSLVAWSISSSPASSSACPAASIPKMMNGSTWRWTL